MQDHARLIEITGKLPILAKDRELLHRIGELSAGLPPEAAAEAAAALLNEAGASTAEQRQQAARLLLCRPMDLGSGSCAGISRRID